MRMDGRHFLCISVFFALIQSTLASGDLPQKHLNTTAQCNSTSGIKGTAAEDQPRGSSRRNSTSQQRQHVPRHRLETGRGGSGSVKHCVRLMDTCSASTPCCSPCALCHCRRFNTICQCRRIGVCSRKN